MSSSDGLVVVERSKQEAPAWSELQRDKLHQLSGTFRYVVRRDQIVNLPLGIKQTQIAAMTSSRQALEEKLTQVVEPLWRGIPGVSPSDVQSGLRTLNQSTKLAHDGGAKIVDIYFEKVSRRAPKPGQLESFYRSNVLVEFPQQLANDALRRTADQLAARPSQALRDLGKALSQLPNPAFSH